MGKTAECEAGSPYGKIVREASRFEKPMNQWVRLFDKDDDISIVTGSAFAYDFDGENLGITIFRNGLFGDLRTEDLDQNRYNRYMNQGVTTGSFRVVFGKNPEIEANAFNNPPIILCEANHDGIFESEKSFFENENKNILLGAMKKAEDTEGVVIRLFNTSGAVEKTEVSVFGSCYETTLNPEEIKTLLVKADGIAETNMLEE